ncbi:4'-phosphopantetheinyl transferase [Paraburkholderia sp. Clong3]
MHADMIIWIATAEDLARSVGRNHVDVLFDILSDDEHARLNRFRYQRDRDVYLLAHSLLRIISAGYLGLPDPAALQFNANSRGKPELAEHVERFSFNLSHSGTWVAVGVSEHGPCGVDIEAQRQTRDWPAIADRFFCASERNAIANSVHPYSTFLGVWTSKEAYLKATGDGLSRGLNSFSVVDATGAWRLDDTNADESASLTREAGTHYHVAACVLGKEDASFDFRRVEMLDPEALYHMARQSRRVNMQ